MNPDISAAIGQLGHLSGKVGFSRVETLPLGSSAIPIDSKAALWASDYAYLLMWPLEKMEAASIEAQANAAESWFDEFLSNREANAPGLSLDGYLVLALPEQPDPEVEDIVRRLELSSQICRKHIIWPASDSLDGYHDAWLRVADITVLGLPEADMAAAGELVWPQIDSESEALWGDLSRMGAPATAQKDAMG